MRKTLFFAVFLLINHWGTAQTLIWGTESPSMVRKKVDYLNVFLQGQPYMFRTDKNYLVVSNYTYYRDHYFKPQYFLRVTQFSLDLKYEKESILEIKDVNKSFLSQIAKENEDLLFLMEHRYQDITRSSTPEVAYQFDTKTFKFQKVSNKGSFLTGNYPALEAPITTDLVRTVKEKKEVYLTPANRLGRSSFRTYNYMVGYYKATFMQLASSKTIDIKHYRVNGNTAYHLGVASITHQNKTYAFLNTQKKPHKRTKALKLNEFFPKKTVFLMMSFDKEDNRTDKILFDNNYGKAFTPVPTTFCATPQNDLVILTENCGAFKLLKISFDNE